MSQRIQNKLGKYEYIFSKQPNRITESGQRFYINTKIKVGRENKIKVYLKRFPNLFRLIRFLASPVLKIFVYSAREFIGDFTDTSLIINVGSGNSKLSENIINVDIDAFENVDIVASAEDLPFKDSSVDGIVSEVLLEHVPNVDGVVKEFYRILKPGGRVFVVVPFLYPFHAVPEDYNRWTLSGVELLFKDFEKVKIDICAGPVSTLILNLSYFLALPFSLLGRNLYEYVAYFFMVIMFPFKFLDLLFRRFPGSHYSSSIFSAVFKK